MVVFPHIKVNIGLYITSKRPDEYHNIESVFYPVPWAETLEICDRYETAWESEEIVQKAEAGKVRFMSYGIEVPGEVEENLCIKVYQRLDEWFNLPAIDVHLLKTLPIGAGLGGGSSDAAFMLKALKEYFNLTLSDKEAMDILAEIGSDCPFFWKDRPMFVFGRGEQMRPIELDLSGYYMLVVNPGIHISTKEAYSGVNPTPPPIDLNLLSTLEVKDWKGLIHNDFEKSIFPNYPEIETMKNEMYSLGAEYAQMTGSGSSVYGLFRKEVDVPQAWQSLSHWQGPLAH